MYPRALYRSLVKRIDGANISDPHVTICRELTLSLLCSPSPVMIFLYQTLRLLGHLTVDIAQKVLNMCKSLSHARENISNASSAVDRDPSIKVVKFAIICLLIHDCCFPENILQNVDNTKVYKE